jgi:hypothetical protein
VSYTAVYSLTDELVVPAAPDPVGAMAGAGNVLIQDVCPGRAVEHAAFAWDAAVFAVAMDAFTHPGPAVPTRVDKAACLQYAFAGVDPIGHMPAETFTFPDFSGVPAEPALKPYARAQTASAAPAAGAAAAPAPAAGGELPATGAGSGVAGLGVLALVAGLATRRRR